MASNNLAARSSLTLVLQAASNRSAETRVESHSKRVDDNFDSADCERVCALLTVHMQLTQSIFYPALRRSLDQATPFEKAQIRRCVSQMLVERGG